MRGPVLIADDHPIVREALTAAVRATWPECVVQEVDSVAGAEAAVRERKPVLCVIDLVMPDANGFSGLLLLQRLAPEAKMVVVSGREDAQTVASAHALEADAYLSKSTPMAKIADTLKRVMAGERVFPDVVETSPATAASAQVRKRLESLSGAQLRILLALADGRLNKQIAGDMGLTEATVKAHLTAIFRKLGVANRTQAVLVARPLLSDGA